MQLSLLRPTRTKIILFAALAMMGFGLIAVTQSAKADVSTVHIQIDAENGTSQPASMEVGSDVADTQFVAPGSTVQAIGYGTVGTTITISVYSTLDGSLVYRSDFPVPDKPSGFALFALGYGADGKFVGTLT